MRQEKQQKEEKKEKIMTSIRIFFEPSVEEIWLRRPSSGRYRYRARTFGPWARKWRNRIEPNDRKTYLGTLKPWLGCPEFRIGERERGVGLSPATTNSKTHEKLPSLTPVLGSIVLKKRWIDLKNSLRWGSPGRYASFYVHNVDLERRRVFISYFKRAKLNLKTIISSVTFPKIRIF